MVNFRRLKPDLQDRIKDLINRMATNKSYHSPLVKYHLQGGYNYGEIRPIPHRFFFFFKGSNLVFFDYVEKKKDSIDDAFYKKLDRKKEKYEKEFDEYLRRGR